MLHTHQPWITLRAILDTALPLTVLLAAVCYSLVCGFAESRINADYHHWGVMYANAVDLLHGYTPYLETFEMYGLLSSLINALALWLFGETLTTLGELHSVIYALILCATFYLLQSLTNMKIAALLVIFQICLHPYINYPWPNHYAYLFFLLSIIAVRTDTPIGYWLTGLLAAAAFLSRHTYAPLIGTAFLSYFLVFGIQQKWDRQFLFNMARSTIGFAGPLLLLLSYLLSKGLIEDFITLTFLAPIAILDTYLASREVDSLFEMAQPLLIEMFGLPQLSTVSIFMMVINYTAVFVIIRGALRLSLGKFQEPIDMLLAVVMIVSYANLFPQMSLFRFVNSGYFGAVLLARVLYEYTRDDTRKRAIGAAVIYSSLLLAIFNTYPHALTPKRSMEVLFHPTHATHVIKSARRHPIAILDRRYRPPEDTRLRQNIAIAINQYRKACGITHLANLTLDPTLRYLVPEMKKTSRVPYFQTDILFPRDIAQEQKLAAAGKVMLLATKPILQGFGYSWHSFGDELGLLLPPGCQSN
jgi:hypothetical protein